MQADLPLPPTTSASRLAGLVAASQPHLPHLQHVKNAPLRCLLVGQDADAHGLLQRWTQGADAVGLVTAASADEALALLAGCDDIGLVCVDAQAPGVGSNGGQADLSLAARLRADERTRELPLIVITDAAEEQSLRLDGQAQGASVHVLLRPLAPGVLENSAALGLQQARQRRAHASERKACDDAMRLNAIVADVLGHDMRSPLSAILMSAELLKRRPDEAVQKTGARLARSANWMARMIQDMLDLTRGRIGLGLALARSPTDLAPVLQRVLDERRSEFPDNALQLSQHGSLHGNWDASRVRQLLAGLLGNALHHGAPGQPVAVLVDGGADDTLRLSIHNHGAIDAALLPHVFDPLHGAARRTSPPEGLGFGLYIAQQIALAHGGELVLQSDAATGTRVDVVLPRGLTAGSAGGTALPADPAVAAPSAMPVQATALSA